MEKTIEQYQKDLFVCQERAIRIEASDDESITEDQIQKRISELRNHIINSESVNNRFRNPALQKIWSAPPRIKRNY